MDRAKWSKKRRGRGRRRGGKRRGRRRGSRGRESRKSEGEENGRRGTQREEGVEVGGEWLGKEEVEATEIKSRVKLLRQSDCVSSKCTAT